jgi:hypothetical protein
LPELVSPWIFIAARSSRTGAPSDQPHHFLSRREGAGEDQNL